MFSNTPGSCRRKDIRACQGSRGQARTHLLMLIFLLSVLYLQAGLRFSFSENFGDWYPSSQVTLGIRTASLVSGLGSNISQGK